MRRRQIYAEVEQRKEDAQRAVIAGTLDQVSAFDPENYRVIVAATPSKPAPSLPTGPVAPVMRRRQLLPLQGDGPDGPAAKAGEVASEPDTYKTIRVDPGYCGKCGKHVGRGVAFHRARCRG